MQTTLPRAGIACCPHGICDALQQCEPLVKVRGLITYMIATLEAKAGSSCHQEGLLKLSAEWDKDEEIKQKTEIELLTPRVIQASAKSAEVKAEVSTLQMNVLSGSISGRMDQLRRLEAGPTQTAKPTDERPRRQQVGNEFCA